MAANNASRQQDFVAVGTHFGPDKTSTDESQPALPQDAPRPEPDSVVMPWRDGGIPEITYDAPGSESTKSQLGRHPSNAGSDMSHISHVTVLDRGEKLYAKAHPLGTSQLQPLRPAVVSNRPLTLSERLMSLRHDRGERDGTFFFPRGSIEEIVTEQVVAETIRQGIAETVRQGRGLANPPPVFTENDIANYARRVCGTISLGEEKPETFRKIFAILVLMRRGWEVVLFVNSGVSDASLPLEEIQDENNLPSLRHPSDPATPLSFLADWTCIEHEDFERRQWTMLAPFFARSPGQKHSHFYQLTNKDILPWTSKEGPIHGGGYSEIFRVAIHPCHNGFDISRINDGKFAVKILKTTDQAKSSHPTGASSFKNSTGQWAIDPSGRPYNKTLKDEFMDEIEILNRFSDGSNPHLVSLLAAYQRGSECALIFHWADCDLKQFWKKTEPGSPLDKANLEWVLSQCRGIAMGLHKIHRYVTTESWKKTADMSVNRKIYGRHGDIKPDNILLYLNKEKPNDRGTLVITDFGLTRFHSESQRTYFPNRTIPTTPTYRPPECDMEGCTISPSFDIWSYGCVLLEFVAWYLGGWTLVNDFVQFRKAKHPLVDFFSTDHFFEISRPPNAQESNTRKTYATVNPKVVDFVNQQLHGHPMCSDIIHDLLDFIMESMLVVESRGVHRRANSHQVRLELDKLYQRLVDPSYQLVGSPRDVGANTYPEGAEIELNDSNKNFLARPERYSQLPEFRGDLSGSSRV